MRHETELSVFSSQRRERGVTFVPRCPPAPPIQVMPTAFRPLLYNQFGVGAVCALGKGPVAEQRVGRAGRFTCD